ncbi:MAG TPA: DUF167 domain-containing protein [Streptosporangiaceae bacterium]
MRIAVRVRPGSARPGVGGQHDGALVVRVSARAVDGQATAAALAAVAAAFGVRRRAVTLVAGHPAGPRWSRWRAPARLYSAGCWDGDSRGQARHVPRWVRHQSYLCAAAPGSSDRQPARLSAQRARRSLTLRTDCPGHSSPGNPLGQCQHGTVADLPGNGPGRRAG